MANPSQHADLKAAARTICERLASAGYRAVWAGGCVRDLLLGRPFHDIDIATSARPEEVVKLFPHTRQVGRSFGVVLVEQGGHWFEVATFREDLDYRDGRRPVGVRFADEVADARRRDFTINGMFYDPLADEVRDHIGGRADLAARQVRAIGEPRQRFTEDRLRMLRAVRFAATLDFEIEPTTAAAIREFAPTVTAVAAERLRDELTRLWLEAVRPGAALRQLEALALLSALLPEVAALRGLPHAAEHHPEGDVFEHTASMLDLLERRTAALAWAVLLHDIGKAAVYDANRPLSYPRHDKAGADLAAGVMARFRFPKRLAAEIVTCVQSHMRYHSIPRMRLARLRRWMADPAFDTGLELHRLDMAVRGADCAACHRVEEVRRTLATEAAVPAALIRGDDLLALGVPPGRELGRWLRRAMDRQLETPGITREALLQWLRGELQRAPTEGGTTRAD